MDDGADDLDDDVISETVQQVRNHLTEVVDRADRFGLPTIITRRGRPAAAVVPMEILRRHEEQTERRLDRIVDERMARPSPGVPLDEVLRETLEREA